MAIRPYLEPFAPHRRLHITGDDIRVSISGDDLQSYPASEMSDGERAIFYMIGQTLTAERNSVLIIDEPELHVHPSIMAKLWDELEATRSDCCFVFITHDLSFAASRVAQKFVIRDFSPSPSANWIVESVPDAEGFDEETVTLILGSRRPILFVEGGTDSLDTAIYRCCYPEWTVIARGSCEAVIHSVVTMRSNSNLTRVTCSGIVNSDAYDDSDRAFMAELGIGVLAVSEIENLILLPAVSRAIAESEGYSGSELQNKLDDLTSSVFKKAEAPGAIDTVVLRYCRRQINRELKAVDLSDASTIGDLAAEYCAKTAALDINAIAKGARETIQSAMQEGDLPKFLTIYDDKGLLAVAASKLRNSKLSAFEDWLTLACCGTTKFHS